MDINYNTMYYYIPLSMVTFHPIISVKVYGFIGGSVASKNNFGRKYGFIIIILLLSDKLHITRYHYYVGPS